MSERAELNRLLAIKQEQDAAYYAKLAKLRELEAREKANAPKFSNAVGPVTSFGQGASAGFSDELYGASQALLPYPLGAAKGEGDTLSGLYDEAVDQYRANQSGYAAENPMTALGFELGGGVATGVGGGGKVAGSKAGQWLGSKTANMNNIMKYGATGAGAGAVAGAGYSDEDKLAGAGAGGILGGIVGGVAPVVTPVLGHFGASVRDRLKHMVDMQSSPDVQASRHFAKAMERDEITPQQLQERLDQLGPEALPAEAGGENMLGLLEAAATIPGKGKNQMIQALRDRQMRSGQRIEGIISEEISGKPATVQIRNEMATQRKTAAKPLYDTAYQVVPELSDDLVNLANRPIVKDAIRDAIKKAQNEGREFGTQIDIDTDGVLTFNQAPSLEVWDQVKRSLDDIISDNTDKLNGANSTARQAQINKRQLVDMMDSLSPEYAQARSIYSGSRANEGAMDMGRRFFRDDYDIIEERLAGMSQSEKDFYKMGVARAFQDEIRKRATKGDKTRIFDKESVHDRLRPVFDDDEALNRFIERLGNEERMSQTYVRATGNSRTAARDAGREDIKGPVMPTAETPTQVALNMLLYGKQKASEPAINSLSGMLTSRNPADVTKALNLINTQLSPVWSLPRYAPYSAVGVGGGTIGAAGHQ